MSLSKSVYNPDWSNKDVNPDFAVWVRAVSNDPYSAYCSFCKKKFSLSNMGKQALTSHAKNSKRHKRLVDSFMKSSSLREFVEHPKEEKSEEKSGQPLSEFLVKQNAFKAEIIWA